MGGHGAAVPDLKVRDHVLTEFVEHVGDRAAAVFEVDHQLIDPDVLPGAENFQ